MSAKIIDGKAVSALVKEKVREEIKRDNLKVGLAVVIVGDDPASRVYVNNKKKACEFCGIKSFEYALPGDCSEQQLLELIDTLNTDSAVNGILVQLPLPAHLDEKRVIERISPIKDVDAFHESNVGRIMIGNYSFLPCTPAGCMELIHSTGIEIAGKECVVIGRSNIVGKPMAMLLLHENATVTICHSKTQNLAEVCRRADILVAAVGRANFVTADMVKEGAIVIDVGINRLDSGKTELAAVAPERRTDAPQQRATGGKTELAAVAPERRTDAPQQRATGGNLCGDVKFDEVSEKAGFITPVPGGVGPMTIAMLMRNTVTACRIQSS